MASDGTFAVSVGTDKKILMFDIRCMKAVGSMDATNFSEMHEIALFNQQSTLEGHQQNLSSMGGMPTSPHTIADQLNGFAAVGHNDGSVSIWNLNMRQCFATEKLHS
jgi:WD40 repeat protein